MDVSQSLAFVPLHKTIKRKLLQQPSRIFHLAWFLFTNLVTKIRFWLDPIHKQHLVKCYLEKLRNLLRTLKMSIFICDIYCAIFCMLWVILVHSACLCCSTLELLKCCSRTMKHILMTWMLILFRVERLHFSVMSDLVATSAVFQRCDVFVL